MEANNMKRKKDTNRPGETNSEKTLKNQSSDNVKAYNFKEPAKFSKQQISTLNMLFENFAREAATTLTTSIQSNCEIEVVDIEQKAFQEILKNMPQVTALSLINFKQLEGQAIIEFSLDTVQSIVHRVYGGQDEDTSSPAKDLTTIERNVLKRIITDLLKVLEVSFENLEKLNISLDRIETNPAFIQQVAPAMEICIKVSLNVIMLPSKNKKRIDIILPFLMLESLLPKLTSSSVWLSKIPDSTNDSTIVKQLESNLENSTVDFRVEVGKTHLTLKEIESIAIGDIIPLDTRIDEQLKCFAEYKEIARGKIGIHRSKKAILIETLTES